MVWPTRRPAAAGARAGRAVPATGRRLLDAAGIAGLAVVGLLVWRTNQYSGFMFQGGLVLLSVATAATVAAAVTPGSLLGRALGSGPLRWLGVRSYGIYLWHYPVIVLTAAAGAAGGPVSVERAAAIVAGTVAVAAASWRFIEEPIRRGARLRWAAPAGTTEPSEAKATGGAGMTGEPGTSTGGGRPRRLRRPRLLRSPLAVGGLCLLAGGRGRRHRDRVHAADLGHRAPGGGAPLVGIGFDAERPAVQLRRKARDVRARRQAGQGSRRASSRAVTEHRRRAGRPIGARAADAAAADLVHRPWCTSATPRPMA